MEHLDAAGVLVDDRRSHEADGRHAAVERLEDAAIVELRELVVLLAREEGDAEERDDLRNRRTQSEIPGEKYPAEEKYPAGQKYPAEAN